jgi:hypothetical protein
MNNVGGIDRVARIVVGILLLLATVLGLIGAWGWIGLVPLATGLFKSCPLYKVIGFDSCPIKAAKDKS